jgi:predicted nucleic acid-binding protein
MKVAIDTNILAYAEGLNGAVQQPATLRVIDKLTPQDTVIPVQVLGELFNILTRKARWKAERARATVEVWRGASRAVDTTAELMRAAISLACQHRLPIWDAIVLSAASEAQCGALLSEDFQDGFVWQGVTVCNPFAPKPHPLIAHLIRP